MKKIAIRSLRISSLRLRKELLAEIIQLKPSLFVARVPELRLLLSATGRTPTAAATQLRAGIARQYFLLKRAPRLEQKALHITALRSLSRFVKEDKFGNESVSSGQKAARKTRIHRKRKHD